MKRLTAIIILIIGFFAISTAFALSPAKKLVKPAETAAAEHAKEVDAALADANGSADVNSMDPNEAAEIEKRFEEATKLNNNKMHEIMRQSSENRVKMLEVMQKQAIEDLEFIRGLAVQEGAKKTVKAIDLSIENRKVRYEEMIENAKSRQEREAAKAERDAKRDKKDTTRRPVRR